MPLLIYCNCLSLTSTIIYYYFILRIHCLGGFIKVGCSLRFILHNKNTSVGGITDHDKAQSDKCCCWYNIKVPVERPLREEDGFATSWLATALDHEVKRCFIFTELPWNARQYPTRVVARLSTVIFKPDESPVIPTKSLAAVIRVAPDADQLLS